MIYFLSILFTSIMNIFVVLAKAVIWVFGLPIRLIKGLLKGGL